MNDGLRAAVFARDKGICSFSGLSLWYLDHGTAPFSHPDWVDHVRPRSRNGADTLENLVCASYFYNRKKLNNAADRQYLFREGKPTEDFFWTHGELTKQQAGLLAGHSRLVAADWYFNRAIFNLTVAIKDELARAEVVRTRAYWLKSAQKRMSMWRTLSGGDPRDFRKRRLVRYPDAPDVKLMLSLATAPDQQWNGIFEGLRKWARRNEITFARFLRATLREQRVKIIVEAEASSRATQPLIEVMKRNAVTMKDGR